MTSDHSQLDWEPDIRTLRCFVTVAEEKSITRAALRLRIAQPALSRKIANLEHDLKVGLFDRSIRGVELTPAGKILLDRAYAVFGQLAQTFHDVTANAERPAGTVVLGMPPTPGELIAPALLRGLKQKYPDIEVQFREGFSRELENWLLSGQIGIAVMHNPPERDDLRSNELLAETLHLIGARGSLEPRSYSLREAAALPLLMPSRPNYLRVLADRHADMIGVELNVVLRVDGTRHLKALLQDGHGFTLLTYGGAMTECNLGSLSAAPIVSPQVEWRLCTVMKTDQNRNLALCAVESEIVRIASDMVAAGIWH